MKTLRLRIAANVAFCYWLVIIAAHEAALLLQPKRRRYRARIGL